MTRVVIIGGGISAMAAAKRLSLKGVSIVILEALDRLGGRIHTVKVDGQNYDLGASWMHDTLVNPLFRMCVDQGIPTVYDDEVQSYYTRDGFLASEGSPEYVANDIYDSLRIDYALDAKPRPEISLQQYSVDFVNNWPLISEKNKVLAPRMIQLQELWSGVEWSKTPASNAFLSTLGRNAFVLNGMDQVFDWVYNSVNMNNVEIHKNTLVNSIGTTESGAYEILATGKNLTADYVLCTIPLGGLHNFHESLFKMPLPEPLVRAMKNGYMAKLGKVVFEFDEKWWHGENDGFKYIVDKNPAETLPVAPGNQPIDWITAFRRSSNYTKPCMMALTPPPLTQYIESNPEKAFDFLLPSLNPLRKDLVKPVPKPSLTLVTNWTLNPWFDGSYSGLTMGHTFQSIIDPFMDGAGKLRFAGEHTVYEGNGCVQGAYESGLREASWILEDIKKSEK